MTLSVQKRNTGYAQPAHNRMLYAHFRIMQSRNAVDCRKRLISGGVATCG